MPAIGLGPGPGRRRAGAHVLGAVALGLVLSTACNTVVRNCESGVDVDCCVEDQDCRAFYGSEFPYCYFPGPETGTCAECRTADDCPGANEVCAPDAVIGAFCSGGGTAD